LRDAEQRRDGADVEAAFIAVAIFGADESAVPVINALARERWHTRHQDIAEHLGDFGAAGMDVVGDLEFLAWAGPEYQDYEGSTALTSHAIHALGRVASPEAGAALERLREFPDDNIRATVRRVEGRMPPSTT
jgi:hypothetical protein